MFYGPVSVLFREMSIEIFCSVFSLIYLCVFYMELHELFLRFGVKSISFANNFSLSEGRLFLLVRISFAVQTLLIGLICLFLLYFSLL